MLETLEGYLDKELEGEKREDKVEKFYKKLKELGVNTEELEGVLEEEKDMLVVSSAGAGKTTGIILKLIRDIISGRMTRVVEVRGEEVRVPSEVLVCTFLKTGAEDLRAKLREWIEKLELGNIDISHIHFRTIHAEVYDAIKKMGVPVSILENGTGVIKTVMKKYGITRQTRAGRTSEYEEVKDMEGLLSYTRNRLDEKRYENSLLEEFGLNSQMLEGLLKDTKKMRQVLGGMDFEDMQEMLLEALPRNKNVEEFIKRRYDYIYVDEFQDTSQLQYEILKYYFEGAKRVICVGDDDQTIYSWRGSDVNIITKEFAKDYNPVIRKLSTNYRCRKNILNAVIPSIEKNSNRHKKELKGVKEGGELRVEYGSGVGTLRENILKDLGEGKTVGVLGRTNADLMLPALILEIEGGLNFTVSKGVTATSHATKVIWGAMELVIKRWGENHEYYLRQILPKQAHYDIQVLTSVLKANKGYSIYTLEWEDIKSSIKNGVMLTLLYRLRQIKEREGDKGCYFYILEYLKNEVYRGESEYAIKMRTIINFTQDLIYRETGKYYGRSLEEINQELTVNIPENLIKRIKYSGKETKIKLTTVHEAKGKEWDSVYIWGDVEKSFPKILESREITEEEREEERRVHYIAWTRAKDKLTVYTEKGKEGQFLKECKLS